MSFFNRLEKLSFKDVLAMTFNGSFLFFCFYALKSNQALKLVEALIPPIGIILTGYFASELSAAYINRSQQRKTGRVPAPSPISDSNYYDPRFDDSDSLITQRPTI